MIKRITVNGETVALLIRNAHKPGLEFFTAPEEQLQLARMAHPKGHTIPPHEHNLAIRTLTGTPEVLYVKSGTVQVDFSPDTQELIERGDWLMLLRGQHGFKFLEHSEVWEIKLGPYLGDQDKVPVPLWEGGPLV